MYLNRDQPVSARQVKVYTTNEHDPRTNGCFHHYSGSLTAVGLDKVGVLIDQSSLVDSTIWSSPLC